MTGVLGMLALLAGDDIGPVHHQRVETARRSAEGLLVLLDDILDFSKLESGKCVVDEANCDPAQIAAAVIELLRPNAEAKGLVLSMHMGPSMPEAAVTDAARLRQILFNLIGNAIKFTASGQVSVRAQRGADLPGDRYLLEFEVEDTGIGIAPEIIPTLFHHFTQADSSITRTYGGSGLGLAISKRLCELLGGTISVTSTPGKGSVFRFGVAVRAGDVAALRVEPSADDGAAASRLPPLRILVVDDNAVNQQVVGGLLTRAGHRVVTVDSGPAAVAAINGAASDRFDVVLMDVQMPGMDGLTATGHIRALPPPQNSVPVIALTAHASNSSRVECLGAGMNGFVTKPVRLRSLLDEIALVLALPERQAPEPLLDTGQVDELTASLSPDAWQRIIASFEDSAGAEIERIGDALKSGLSPARAAHTLKGCAWNTGAICLGNLAKQLETAPPAEAQRLAVGLRPLLQRTTTALLASSRSHAEA